MQTLRMQKGGSSSALSFPKARVALVGPPIDDRGHAATAALRGVVDELIECEYDPENATLAIGGTTYNAQDLPNWADSLESDAIYLETTTLGLVEILLLLRTLLQDQTSQVHMLYVEPESYSRGPTGHRAVVVSRRDFALSDKVHGYRGIPFYAGMLSDRLEHRVLFFLGYEQRRLETALEDYPVKPNNCSVVYGVPAFRAGWEMDSFANNVNVIDSQKVSGGTHFCGAENPLAAFEVVQKVHAAMPEGTTLFIAPIGTKPHGLGAALFASLHPDTKVLYDHPQRKVKRTGGVGHWHLFTVQR